jgi:hypothetical protein
MLYQCALDAQLHCQKDLSFIVLRKIIQDYDEDWMTSEAKSEIRLPVMLRYLPPPSVPTRCVIRMTFAATERGKTSDPTYITLLCSQFEIAAKKAEEMRRRRSAGESVQFPIKELEWFSQNAYNCAVTGCGSEYWDRTHIISMTDSCLKVRYP